VATDDTSTTPTPGPSTLVSWFTRLSAELGIDLDVDLNLLLDVARDAAHGVARPAAPLTTFLVGYAAARAGGTPHDVRRNSEIAARLAVEHGANRDGAQ
jgi:hypothetical protein